MPDTPGSGKHRAIRLALVGAMCLAGASQAAADDCAPEPQGEGRVAAVIDARTLRLDDGRLVRLSGLAPMRGVVADRAAAFLATLAVGRTVSLHGDGGTPDRYGRQHLWLFAAGDTSSLQEALVAGGQGLRDIAVVPAACRHRLDGAERAAQADRKGLWIASEIVKNAESPDDISTEIGHFSLIEGRVRSVRVSGGTTYLNFGRRWTQGFAVMMPKRAAVAYEATRVTLKSFEGKTIRVRGYVSKRGGPRIEAASVEQIEAVGANAATGIRD